MKVGILGGSGYIGSHIVGATVITPWQVVVARRSEVDYGDVDQLSRWLRDEGVSFLINAAGFTGRPNVDACELQKAECILGNAVLPGIVRSACERADIPFGHVSSGCIFTGSKPDGSGFNELDAPNFCFRTNHCSFYSGCKALGEEVLDGCENCYVWRLRIPFSHEDHSRNYLSKLLRYRRLLDARNSLTNLHDFANCCVTSIQKQIPFGTYNLTNGGSVTTREVVEMLRETIAPDRTFDFFESEDVFMRDAVTTPRSNCVLDNQKALDAGLPLRDIRSAIRESLEQWQPEITPVHGR